MIVVSYTSCPRGKQKSKSRSTEKTRQRVKGNTRMSKTFEKKVLTKGNECDILTKLSAREDSERTLKIEQRKTREETKQGTSKRRNRKNSLNS